MTLALRSSFALLLWAPGAFGQTARTDAAPPSPSASQPSPSPAEPPESSPAEPSEPSPPPTSPAPASPTPTSPAPTSPAPASPTPTSPAPAPDPPPPRAPLASDQELTLQDRSGQLRAMREPPSQVTLSYATALPLGPTRSFVGDFSFAGFGLDWHRRVRDNAAVGLSLGWQVLYDKLRATSVMDTLTVTGVQVRHVNMFPVLLSGRFFPSGAPSRVPRPYLGLGIGVFPAEWRADIGLLSYSSFSVHFGVAPEVGLQIPTRLAGAVCLGVRYNYGFESAGNPEISSLSFTVGLAR